MPPEGGNTVTNSFDDAEGFYIPVIHDQIAYRYEILKVLGKGSFGQVIKAFDHKHSLYVAIKIVRNTDDRFTRQAEEEVRMLKLLNAEDADERANVVRMFDHFVFRNHTCIVFELLSLDFYELMRLNKFRGMTVDMVRKPATSILHCLELLRRHNVVHSDLKPENILLRKVGRSAIKVVDFGSSCFEHTQLLTYVQSRFYRAPEIILGAGFGCPIDMWSLGCILAELVTGRPLFAGEDEADQLTCMMESLGLPPRRLLVRSKRVRYFFSTTTGYPRYCSVLIGPDGRARLSGCVTRKGRRRGPPGSRDLAQVLDSRGGGGSEVSSIFPVFLDFVKRCLEWDPQLRMTPEQALKHEWLSDLV